MTTPQTTTPQELDSRYDQFAVIEHLREHFNLNTKGSRTPASDVETDVLRLVPLVSYRLPLEAPLSAFEVALRQAHELVQDAEADLVKKVSQEFLHCGDTGESANHAQGCGKVTQIREAAWVSIGFGSGTSVKFGWECPACKVVTVPVTGRAHSLLRYTEAFGSIHHR